MNQSHKGGLSPTLRVGLDVLRGAAATYVVVYHVVLSHNVHGLKALPFRFGQEAVIVFFLLSGFVIFANERDRVQDVRSYLLRRLRRIYPLLLISMGVAALVALSNGAFIAQFRWGQFVATLLSVEDVQGSKPGVIAGPFLRDQPLWSLSYEVAFYLLFPVAMICWRRSPRGTSWLVGLTSLLGYGTYLIWPNHFSLVLAYFLLWWCGAVFAAAYLRNGNVAMSAVRLEMTFLALLCGLAVLAIPVRGWRGADNFPALPIVHFVFAFVALALALTPAIRKLGALLLPLGRPAAYLASISYGLYVLHYPLLINWHIDYSLPGFVVAAALLLTLCALADRQLDRVLPRPGRARPNGRSAFQRVGS